MISLKKLIDLQRGGSNTNGPASSEQTEAESGHLLAAHHAALAAMAANGQRAVPVLGTMIQSALTRISKSLGSSPSPEAIEDSRVLVDEALSLWADKAQHNQKESEQTLRDLLQVVSEATESTGTRDEKFGREIAELGNRLRAVAGLDNLPVIRRSITENASALTECVARMTDEGRESVRKLNSEIAEYQTRLLASERRALVDPLTGLCNRRGFEQQLELRVQGRQPFSLLIADLNGFKAANDLYGHLVGDEILKRFASELKSQFLPEDTVARWGGDEFVCIVNGAAKEGTMRADRVRHWVLGEYKITIGDRTIRVVVDAALGLSAWNGVESGLELFARTDKEMYRAKEKSRQLV